MDGIDRFMAGLQELGLKPERRGGLVIVGQDIEPAVRAELGYIGADPPNDFPNIPPHWLHLHRGLVLPEGAAQPSELGDEWRKWSRQHPKWRGGPNASREWLAHARSLLLVAKVA
jgi:hypothetical protein